MAVVRTRYRFGLFEADPHNGRLLRQGAPIRLQEQPFQVLVALLEHHGEIVSRDALRQRLWPGDTFVEFDKSLGVALTKLRAALGDDAANPRFVETVPKRGYRFIAPVTVEPSSADAGADVVTAPSAGSAAPGPVIEAAAVDTARRPPRSFVPRWPVLATAVLAIAGIAGLVWSRSARHPSTGAPGRVSVVIAEFANGTGDPVFVGSLRRAAGVGLRQSPFLSVMADSAIASTLQTLGRAPNDTLTAPLARDVCTHVKGHVLVDGDISLAADTYTLVVEATRCADGAALDRETQTFTTKDDALPALGRAIEAIRTALGESRESLQAYDVPLQIATTDSLEALRAYHLGMDLRSRADNVRAIPALKTAIALDPQFAVAYAQLGSAYSNIGDETDGLAFFVKAFELRDRTTEPERLYITGRYFDIVTREIEKSMETYRLWSGLYPEEWPPLNALANDGNLIGRYDVAAEAAARAAAMSPKQLFPRVNLMTAYAGLNKFTESKDTARTILSLTPDNASAHIALYAIARHLGDEAAAAREVAWGAQHPDSGLRYVEAEDAGLHGRFAEMTRLFREVARVAREGGNAENAGNTLGFSAVINSLAGRSADALADATAAAALGHNEIILGSAGIVYARAGRADAARQSLTTMERAYPLSTYALGMYAPMVRMALAAGGSPAVADVTSSSAAGVPYEMGQQGPLQLPYLRGLAYMSAHAPDLAASEFRKVVDHIGADPLSPLYAMSYLGIARASAASGRTDESRQAYATLRRFWTDADRDAPIVRTALER